MTNQMRLAIMTGAGGVGKTTLAVNLGYEVARLGYKLLKLEFQPFQVPIRVSRLT